MNQLYYVPPVIGFGLSILLAVMAIRQHPYSFVHRIFTFFLVSMGLLALAIFGMRISDEPGRVLLWEKAIFAILPVVSVSFLHFVILLVGAKSYKARALTAAYCCMVLFIGLSPTGLLVAGMRQMWYGHGFIQGQLFLPYAVIFYGIVAMALLRLIRAYRASRSSIERNRYIYVALGAAICLFGFLTDSLAASGIHIYPGGIISNVLFLLITSYAMLKYQLLDFRRVILRAVVYAVLSGAGFGLVIAALTFVYVFEIESWNVASWIKVALVVLMAIALQPALRRAQSRVDKWFYREQHDYLHILESLTEETKALTDLNFIAGSLVNTVTSLVHCRMISVLLIDSEGEQFVSVVSRGIKDESLLQLKRNSILVWWLEQRMESLARQDIVIKPHFKALTAREKALLESLEVELLVPLLTREGLRAILVLGCKFSGQDYSPEEVRMLKIICRQMATTLDNARLYDLQMRRYREQELLARLGMTVSAELDLGKVYPLFIEELKEAIPIDYASISLMGEDRKSPVMAFASSTLPAHEFMKELPADDIALKTADFQVHYQPDLSKERWFPSDERLHHAGVRSLVRMSLRSKGEIFGYLTLGSRKPAAYDMEDIGLLQQVAVQLAIAIDKSQLYESERKARLELENQDAERTNLVNALIHEMKTPITAMLASSELIKEELSFEPSVLGALAENMDNAVRNLDRRVSELMDFAKLQRAEVVLHLELTDINQLAKQAAAYISEMFKAKDQKLRVELADSPGWVNADPDRITQILFNLLTNASKFSDNGQTISLVSYMTNGNLTVEVRDTASPIEPYETGLIFKPYYRRNRGKGSGGLGLGLFICLKLVQLHGGKIWVEPGETGNSFKFSLPLVRVSGGIA